MKKYIVLTVICFIGAFSYQYVPIGLQYIFGFTIGAIALGSMFALEDI